MFIDSDTRIDFDVDELLSCFERYDAVEIGKEVNASSLIEKLARIDYLNMLITSKLSSKLNSCLGLNGAAFAIKGDVIKKIGFRAKINEDTDLGLRLAIKGYKVGVFGKAITKSPSTFKSWLIQRERWAIGGAEVFLEYYKEILKKPRLWIPALLILYPAFLGFLVNLIIQDDVFFKILYFLLPFIVFIPSKLISLVLVVVYGIHFSKNVLVLFSTFMVWMMVILILAEKFKYKIDLWVLPIYYFIYSPFWMMLCMVCLIRVLIARKTGRKIEVEGWVV